MSIAPSRSPASLRRGSAGYLGWMQEQLLADFSGGLNLAAAPSELAQNETPDALNFTLDERGGLTKRLGYKAAVPNNGTIPGSFLQRVFWADIAGGALIVQSGNTLYQSTAWNSFRSKAVFSTSDPVGLAVFNGKLIAVHPVDGVFIIDITVAGNTTATVGSPAGTTCAVWQNRLWVSGLSERLYFSKIADASVWSSPNGGTVDIREKDSQPIVALGSGSGMDLAGRPGLLVFKRSSTYRVNDADTGAFTTLSATAGAVGPLAVTSWRGQTLFVAEDGIYETNGVAAPIKISARLDPLFSGEELNYATVDGVCAAPFRNHLLFSLPQLGSSVNSFSLELHPEQGWIMPQSYAFQDIALTRVGNYEPTPRTVGILASGTGVYEIGTMGSDDGADISCYYQTPWFEFTGGNKIRLRRLRLGARGSMDVDVSLDYATQPDISLELDSPSGGFIWDDASSLWDDPLTVWGPISLEVPASAYSLGVGRAVSFTFSETSSIYAFKDAPLASGLSIEVGAFSLYHVLLDYVPLGMS